MTWDMEFLWFSINGLVYNNGYAKYNRVMDTLEFREGLKYRLTFDPWNSEGK